jgi:hypothetical protein
MTQAQRRTGDGNENNGQRTGTTVAWIGASLREAGWAPLLVFLVYIISAFVFDLFAPLPRLDMVMHFAGGMATAFFVHRAMALHRRLRPASAAASRSETIQVLLLTLAVALLWELAEFTSDRLFGTHEQLGTADTLRDLLAGMLGAVVYLSLPGVFPRVPT